MTVRPLISCLMVTRGGIVPARFAIEAYRRQTYSPRELVIVCDQAATALRSHIDTVGDPSIRFVEAATSTLGDLRNASIAAASGELVAQWDDDDLYHPQRLELQAIALASAPHAAAHFLSRWFLWWPTRRLLAVSARRIWEGTMLARRSLLPPYPSLSRGEDSIVVKRLFASHPNVESDVPEVYCYVVHGRNCWDEGHFDELFRCATRRFEGEAYDVQLSLLARVLPVHAYAQAIAEA
jgi:glycosyltransferase involved in cell wall biosynthesis